MSDLGNKAKDIFLDALEQSGDIEAFLAEACGDDAELRERVQALLDAHHEAGDFLTPSRSDETIESGKSGFGGSDPIIERCRSQSIVSDRALQTAGADWRRRHGLGLGGESIQADQTQGCHQASQGGNGFAAGAGPV